MKYGRLRFRPFKKKIKEEATKIADDLIRDRVPQLIDQIMKEFLDRKNAS